MEHHTADLNVLRTRVCLIVDNICKNALQEYNRERSSSTEAGSPCFDLGRRTVDSITELVMLYASTLAEDLRSFCKHAKRQTINVEDVLLCARKSEILQENLQKFIEETSRSEKAVKRVKTKKPEVKANKTATTASKAPNSKKNLILMSDESESSNCEEQQVQVSDTENQSPRDSQEVFEF